MRSRLLVLASGEGTLLQHLIDSCRTGSLRAQIVAVGSDRHGTRAASRAEAAGIATFVCRLGDYSDRADWDKALTEACAGYQPDLVVSAGFMKLFGPQFLDEFAGRCINSHPALLPSFPGMHAVRDALAYGVKVTGCTVFLVDSGLDSGPVVAQQAVQVRDDDDEETLTERIKSVERALLAETVAAMLTDGWSVTGRTVRLGGSGGSRAVTTTGTDKVAITRAIISVYDKTGLDELARELHHADVEIVSTGSTAAAIRAAGIAVTPVEAVTGFPECLDGRVKTLHPAIHAGLLADLNEPSHRSRLDQLQIAPFQLLVSNLYPFTETVASGASPQQCVAQIDVGGPAMVRAAAKNHANVAVVTSPAAYGLVAAAIKAGGFTLEQRRRLAAQAFAHTARYDAAVASWFASVYAPDEVAAESGWPDLAAAVWDRREVLRYGENPHQRAALYVAADSAGTGARGPGGVATAEQLHGKAMSYNNYVDADAAWRAVRGFAPACVAIMKHANPCGIAVGADIAQAHHKAHACDPVSAFGGVIAANRPVTAEMAGQVADIFTEVILAPGYEPAALEILTKKKNLRLLRCAPLGSGAGTERSGTSGAVGGGTSGAAGSSAGPAGSGGAGRAGQEAIEWRQVSGGLLMQVTDTVAEPGDRPSGWRLAAGTAVSDAVLGDLEFAWRACRSVKSNAILLASGLASVGIGMGQVNRVDAARLAVARAGDRATGSVAASDAYFPFADGLQVLAEAGVRAVVEPGGSVRDDEVIAAAEAAGVTLYLTGVRHFWH
jgi:phosphoribosylaminoimidazolecarboxamide formyltransferase/IMP cyclohydrolase